MKTYQKPTKRHGRSWDPEKDLACERPTPKKPGGVRGTINGWNRHTKAGESPCEECVEGRRRENRARYHREKDKYREKRNRTAAQRRERMREQIRESGRAYYQDHKEASRARKRARDAKISHTYDGYTAQSVVAEHGANCYLCGEEVDLSIDSGWEDSPNIDHVIPVSADDFPGDILSNVRISHARCNMVKGPKRVEELNLPLEPPAHRPYKESSWEAVPERPEGRASAARRQRSRS